MNGSARTTKNKEILLNASTGILSGFFYLSYVLSFAFLVPVQNAFAGRGKRSGLAAAAIALAVIAAGQAGRMFEMKVADPAALAAGVIPPLALLLALVFVNSRIGRLSTGWKLLIAAAVLSLAVAPFMIQATSDKEFSSSLVDYVGSMLGSSAMGNASAGAVSEAVKAAVETLQSAFAPLILWMLAGSWWLGSTMAARKASRTLRVAREAETADGASPDGEVREESAPSMSIERLRVPYAALWPTLLCWALLFAALVTKQTGVLKAAAWNVALCAASLYAVQGLAILSHLSKQFSAARALRLLAPLAVLAMLLSSTAAAIILIALPVLGITEVWLPYRNLKGATK